MPPRRRSAAIPLLALGLLALATPAAAQQGEWRLGGRLLAARIDAETEPLAFFDTRIRSDDAWTGEFDATFMLDDDLGLEWMITTAPHDLRAVGGVLDGVDLGEVWIAQSALTLQYHVPLWGRVRPYVGVGLAGAWMHSSSITAAAIDSVTSDVMSGFVAQVGVSYRQGRRWLLSFDIKVANTSGDVRLEDEQGTTTATVGIDLDPVLIGLGAAYRF